MISSLSPGETQNIELKNIRRKMGRVRIVVSAEANNAIKITRTYYGRMIGKFIFLNDYDFTRRFMNAYIFMIFIVMAITIVGSFLLPIFLIPTI